MRIPIFRAVFGWFLLASLALVSSSTFLDAAGPIDFDTAQDIGDLVSVEYQSTSFNRRTGELRTNVVVTNTSNDAIQCPLILVITSISVDGVLLANPSGQSPSDNPFIDLSPHVGADNLLSPGESTTPQTLTFDNPARRRFTFESDCLGLLVLGPPPAPTLDPHHTIIKDTIVTISGTAPRGQSVEVCGPQGAMTAPVVNDTFTATVSLQPNRRNRLFFTVIDADGVRSAPATTLVTHDAQPPKLLLQFPNDGAELTTATTDVAGTVGDMLSGFMGLTVTVNGVEAQVDIGIGTNGTFFAEDIPFNTDSGPVTFTAIAIDQLGNTVTKEIEATRVEIPVDAPRIAVINGNSQEAEIETFLSDPIIVRITHADGTPFPNKVVNFNVTRSNGRLSADKTEGSLFFQAKTDANGNAQAFWKLGSDAGCGNQRVEVTSKDIAGTTFLCATATPAPADQINIGSGNPQRAEAGGPAPEPLVAWVSDSCNGVQGIPVTFTVTQGSGLVNNQSEVTVTSTDTGHAQVSFTLGQEPGNHVIEADFPDNPGNPAVFVVFGVARGHQATGFSGIVLDNGSLPIEGAECSLTINGQPVGSVPTDADGQFLFEDIPDGPAHLHVDGLVAVGLHGQSIANGSFPALTFETTIVANAANSLPAPVLLPTLDPANARAFDNTQDVDLTVDGMDGLKMTVRAGSMTRADGSVPSPADPAIIALNQVHHDDVPMPMPDGAGPLFAWTLQPAGAHFDPPISIEYPNMAALAPGAIAYFLSFNHDTGNFEIVSTASVTPDGSTIISDPGSGITTAGWGCNCPEYTATADCCNPVCVETGELSGGTVTATRELRPADLFETITFTASGVTDSGGSKECPEENTSIPVAPGTVVYRHEVTGPRGFSLSGQGSEVSVLAEDVGDYTCKFFASVERECAPSEFEVGSKSETVTLCTGDMFVAGGAATGRTTFTFPGGQGVRVTVKNLNVLGVATEVSSNFGDQQGIILLPTAEHTFSFSNFGEEPMGWTITFDSVSDAVSVLITIESTWARGCPRNR